MNTRASAPAPQIKLMLTAVFLADLAQMTLNPLSSPPSPARSAWPNGRSESPANTTSTPRHASNSPPL